MHKWRIQHKEVKRNADGSCTYYHEGEHIVLGMYLMDATVTTEALTTEVGISVNAVYAEGVPGMTSIQSLVLFDVYGNTCTIPGSEFEDLGDGRYAYNEWWQDQKFVIEWDGTDFKYYGKEKVGGTEYDDIVAADRNSVGNLIHLSTASTINWAAISWDVTQPGRYFFPSYPGYYFTINGKAGVYKSITAYYAKDVWEKLTNNEKCVPIIVQRVDNGGWGAPVSTEHGYLDKMAMIELRKNSHTLKLNSANEMIESIIIAEIYN